MPRAAATNRFKQRECVTALSFSGVDQYVDIGTAVDDAIAATGEFTIDCFFKVRQTGLQALVCLGGGGAGKISLDLSSGSQIIAARLTNGAGSESTFSSSASGAILRDTWYKGTLTYSSDLATLYLNGASVGTKAYVGITVADGVNRIGVRPTVNDDFNGLIDEVRIWTRALSSTEVSNLYFQNIVPSSGLIAEYLFNEGAGTTANDTSGSGNTGTISGATFSADVPMKARKQVDGNRVKNGDFEYAPPFTAAGTGAGRWIDGTSAGSTTNDLFGWSFLTETGTGSVQFDSSTKNSGSYSIKVSTLATGSLARVSNVLTTGGPDVVNRAIPVTPNTDYDLVYYLKTNYVSGDSNDGAYILVSYADAAGAGISSVSSTKIKTTTDWTRYSVRFTTPATCRFIYPRPGVVGDTGTATLIMDSWFDDISILPVYPEGRVPANGNLVKNFNFEVAPTFVAATTTQNRFVDGTSGGEHDKRYL